MSNLQAIDSHPEPRGRAGVSSLLAHLQTALEIEYSTVPIYLYTYYSINRTPSTFPEGMDPKRVEEIRRFANKAGAEIMSVAVEEMLHMALASNLIRALGGLPDLNLYQKVSTPYPAALPHHSPTFNPDKEAKGEFKVPLARLSEKQIGYFVGIEWPKKKGDPAQGDNWDTIGQFYEYIRDRMEGETTDEDFRHFTPYQLAPGNGYYSPNNIDTLYPHRADYEDAPIDGNHPAQRGASAARYTNADDSGGLLVVTDKGSAKKAMDTICHQGEGTPADEKYDDQAGKGKGKEETHYYKFQRLQHHIKGFSQSELALFVYPFPDNPTRDTYAQSAQYDYRPLADLASAVWTYLFQLMQTSYENSGAAQHMLFNIGMHKGMIFVLDKIINGMRSYHLNGNGTAGDGSGPVVAPTFENYPFTSLATAKQEMIALFARTPPDFQQNNPNILQRMRDLPDVQTGPGGVVRF